MPDFKWKNEFFTRMIFNKLRLEMPNSEEEKRNNHFRTQMLRQLTIGHKAENLIKCPDEY